LSLILPPVLSEQRPLQQIPHAVVSQCFSAARNRRRRIIGNPST
jgi:hypothetical protein